MKPRFIAKHVQRLAKEYPVLTITGPRQSGKTTLSKSVFPHYAYVNLEDLETRRWAKEDPRGFLQQFSKGVILDEIQRAPELPSYIQGIVDTTNRPGNFILTGSQQFEITFAVSQSLAGRTAILKLLPFAFGEIYSATLEHSVSEILYQGFYPRIIEEKLNPTEALSFYFSTYVERDLLALQAIQNLSTFERFLKLCAGQVGQLVNWSALGNDCGIDQKTVKAWLSLLQASYIVYLLPPHFKNFKKRLTKSPKLYFYDVGLACYLLGITSPQQIELHPMRGALFEDFIVTEFLKNRFNQVQDNNLYFFRDHLGNEVDLILDNGIQLVSVEIKSGKTLSSDFFKGLKCYNQLSSEFNTMQYLIYGGTENRTMYDAYVYPYFLLEDLFKKLG